jgi:hypothetical protein
MVQLFGVFGVAMLPNENLAKPSQQQEQQQQQRTDFTRQEKSISRNETFCCLS